MPLRQGESAASLRSVGLVLRQALRHAPTLRAPLPAQMPPRAMPALLPVRARDLPVRRGDARCGAVRGAPAAVRDYSLPALLDLATPFTAGTGPETEQELSPPNPVCVRGQHCNFMDVGRRPSTTNK